MSIEEKASEALGFFWHGIDKVLLSVRKELKDEEGIDGLLLGLVEDLRGYYRETEAEFSLAPEMEEKLEMIIERTIKHEMYLKSEEHQRIKRELNAASSGANITTDNPLRCRPTFVRPKFDDQP